MDGKKPIGWISGRLFVFAALLIAAWHLVFYLGRQLWFDEVITLLNFAALDTPAAIYRTYVIPNNQILHSIILHGLLRLGVVPEIMRLFPLVCGGVMLFLLWRNFARELGGPPLAAALTALALSPPFLLYATALRGYMLAALLTVCALIVARKFALGGRWRHLFLWFLFATLAVAVMPSALAGIAAAGLYAVPYCGKRWWRSSRIGLMAVAPFVGFALFYAPIRHDLLRAFALKEGWHSASGALLATAAALLITFLPLLPGTVFHRPSRREALHPLIWLLPVGGALLPVSPFPRVWFVLFPVFALLMAKYLRRTPKKWLKITCCVTLLWGAIIPLEFLRIRISPLCAAAGQDDFYAPDFARTSFSPAETVSAIENELPENTPVFTSFDADPWSIIYYHGGSLFDGPRGKVQTLPDHTAVILSPRESPTPFAERFHGTLTPLFHTPRHTVYLFRGRQ